MSDKNVKTAFLISVIFTGMGIAYLGDVKKGATLLGAAIILNILGMLVHYMFSYISILIWIYGLYGTYIEAQNMDLI